MPLSTATTLRLALLSLALGACKPSIGALEHGAGTDTHATDSTESSDVSVGDSSDSKTVPNEDVPPRPHCEPGLQWVPGTSAFAEATEAWGLGGVEGIRLSVTDIDADGWPDLIVRNGAGPDDFGPDGQRSRWLLRNSGDGVFEDVTQSSGLLAGRNVVDPNYGRPADIAISGDVDNDGDLDVYLAVAVTDLSNPELETCELMLNDGQGNFSLGPADSAARFVGKPVVPAGATFVDFDRDGNLDLWVVHNMLGNSGSPLPDNLLKGDGAGGFVDVSPQYGISTQPWSASTTVLNAAKGNSWAWSSQACDLNNDGIPELLASSYGRAPNHLWRGELADTGAVSYVNESVLSGYAFDPREDWTDNLSAQCHCADYPEDDECDLAPAPAPEVDCMAFKQAFGGNYRWNHPTDREPWRLGGNSGATTCADIDNDGHIDLLTGEIVHWDVGASSDPAEIAQNLGDPLVRFYRPGNEKTGLYREDPTPAWDHGDMTNAVLDFDNDGWLDVYIGASDYPNNHGLLFRQKAPLSFERLDPADYFQHNRAHGVVTADFDRDGDMDMAVGHSLMRCDGPSGDQCYPTQQIRLFENVLGSSTNWIQLHLHAGEGANRSAIGARVEVTAGNLTQTREVDGGGGHFGTQADHHLHIGLGSACEAQVKIIWPDSERTTETHSLAGNKRWELTAGQPPVRIQ